MRKNKLSILILSVLIILLFVGIMITKYIYDDKNLIYNDKSKYQTIKLYKRKAEYWLELNGQIQFHSAEHEKSHFLQCDIPIRKYRPKKVLILGGGDGFPAEHILRYPFIESVTMVEIDKKMIDMLKKSDLMKRITNNVVNNPKLRIIIGDAKKYVLTCKEKYDMIIEDIEHDYTNNQMDIVDYFDYYKQLLNISNVICTTWDDGDGDWDITSKKDYPIVSKLYKQQKRMNKNGEYIKYEGDNIDLLKEVSMDEPEKVGFNEKENIKKWMNDVKLFITVMNYNKHFGLEIYIIMEKERNDYYLL